MNEHVFQPARAGAHDDRQVKAALLLWEGRLTDQEIAEHLGIHRATLSRWKSSPTFIEMLDQLQVAGRREMELQAHAIIWGDACRLHRQLYGADCQTLIRVAWAKELRDVTTWR